MAGLLSNAYLEEAYTGARVAVAVLLVAFETRCLQDIHDWCSTSEGHWFDVACVVEYFAYGVQTMHSYLFDYQMESFDRNSLQDVHEVP